MFMTKSIKLADETFDRLSKYGKFGQTADELINQILNKIEEV
jgi:hypothetical protein